jgi:predicted O-methyltransferase YrrM
MKDTKEINIKITEESIIKTNSIVSKMKGKSFHNHYHIIYDVCSSIEHNDIIYLEIGTFAGGSASLMSTHPKVTKVVSVDLGVPIDKSIPIENVNTFKHKNCEYTYIQGDSTDLDTINKLKEIVSKVDILLIDGNHTYDWVIKDFNNYKDFVKNGGYIIFDDYEDDIYSPDVKLAVNDLIKTLDELKFEIIGSLKYDLISKTNAPHLLSSNEFIIRKLS